MASILYVLALTVATLAILGSAQKSEFCNLESCRGEPHVLCKYPFLKVSKNCGKVQSSKLTEADIEELLNIHNSLRQRVANGDEMNGKPGPQPAAKKMPPLKWSEELAGMAQTWANQCNYGHQCCHTLNMQVGQNIAEFEASPVNTYTLTDLVKGWYDEVKIFNKNGVKNFSYWDKTGHYTQMVWAKTTLLGCGAIRYDIGDGWPKLYLVCNYGPSGNWAGEAMYEPR